MDITTGRPALRWWFDSLACAHVTAEQSGGALSVIEITEPAGAEAPLHVHHHDDETFYVIEGAVTLGVGDATIALGPGEAAYGPRGVPHRYSVGAQGCRMLLICTPGGLDAFMVATSRPADAAVLPPPSAQETDWEAVAAAARAHGCALLG